MQSVPDRRGGWGHPTISRQRWLRDVPEYSKAAGASALDTRGDVGYTGRDCHDSRLFDYEMKMPRDRVELSTHGFSVHCSTA